MVLAFSGCSGHTIRLLIRVTVARSMWRLSFGKLSRMSLSQVTIRNHHSNRNENVILIIFEINIAVTVQSEKQWIVDNYRLYVIAYIQACLEVMLPFDRHDRFQLSDSIVVYLIMI